VNADTAVLTGRVGINVVVEVEVTLIDVTVEKVVVTEDDEAIVDVVGAELVVVEGTVAADVKNIEIE